ncbi:DUF2505 domain-containing protein [Sediminivirga luteola]|uniref:DUF2505 domain-containing protein n=1 Tax=Sediminivirga luteola TaxID=1774748 RepID=A0A8J2XIY9_9MICO|nr:DUF2505 domain-containing protein [Sediminivirga luteola]GGA18270.1 hypothetical protein GCM10011333_21640 [Sediminivirga luteola]
MPTSFTLTRRVPLAPAALLARLASPEAWPEGSAVTHAGDAAAPSAQAPLRIEATVPLPQDRIPGAVSGFLPAEPVIVQHWVFGSAAEGTMNAQIPGAPAGLDATLTLAPVAEQPDQHGQPATEVQAAVTVSCQVPLFGARIEEAMKPVVADQVDAQLARLG